MNAARPEQEQLHAAAKRGDLAAVLSRLRDPACGVDLRDARGQTALYLAARDGYADVAAALIARGAQVDAQDEEGATPLWIACSNGRGKTVRLLLESGARGDLRHVDGRSPACMAAQMGQEEAMCWLATEGTGTVDLDGADSTGWTPVLYTCQRGHSGTLKILLEGGANPSQAGILNNFVTQWHSNEATPLEVAAHHGYPRIASLLLSAGADECASSTLFAAALAGQADVIKVLPMDAIDCGELMLASVAVACFFGHRDVLEECLRTIQAATASVDWSAVPRPGWLSESACAAICTWLNLNTSSEWGQERRGSLNQSTAEIDADHLHDALSKSGFTCERVLAQIAAASVLESILLSRCSRSVGTTIHVVGSYGEAWGNSLSCMNGEPALDSDIDVTLISPASSKLFHIRGSCKCDLGDTQDVTVVNYENGHVTHSGFATNPALKYGASAQRPAVDIVDAFRCCCYPYVQILENPRHRSQMSQQVIKEMQSLLRGDARTARFPSHLVASSPPGGDGNQLRVSTTFFELVLFRSMTTVQGQVYILLKFVVKRVISRKVRGLKTYHAKTVMFYMMDEEAKERWTPGNLIELLKSALKRLRDQLQDEPLGSSGFRMRHFFLRDAEVYLKTNHHSKNHRTKVLLQIRHEIEDALSELPSILRQFVASLRPVGGQFIFHPFLLHPILGQAVAPTDQASPIEYHNIWDVVGLVFEKLASEERSRDVEDYCINLISRLPCCARITRDCLMILTYLKFNYPKEAVAAARSSKLLEVDWDIFAPDELFQKVTGESLFKRVTHVNSVYKFGFRFSLRPNLTFLPVESIKRCFPCGIGFYLHQYYINFHALLRSLCLHLLTPQEENGERWFRDVLSEGNPDVQDIMMTLEFCQDKELLMSLIQRHSWLICGHYETLKAAWSLLSQEASIQQEAALRTIKQYKSFAY